MVGGPRLRPFVAVALALVLTACSSGPGGGGDATRKSRPTTTTADGSALHDDVVVEGAPPGRAPAPGSTTTTVSGGMAARPGGGRDLPPPSGSTSTTAPGTTSTTTLPPGLPAEKCPEPKSCRHYTLLTADPYRWPVGPDSRATIEYWLNPTGVTGISAEDVEGAVAAAFATWQRAAPTLRFVYRGRTTDRLAARFDGVNVVAFDSESNYADVTQGEFDIHFRPGNWTWAPCEQRDAACTEPGPGEIHLAELQSVATHEVGHVLWLGHPPNDPAYAKLTMSGLKRARQTLALGDVLGVRALYPCDCPLPPIYDP